MQVGDDAMAIDVRLLCSECSLIRDVRIKEDHKELMCPLCGRRLQNLTEEELKEVEQVQKKQQLCSFVAIAFFVLATVCAIMWAVNGCPVSGMQYQPDGKLVAAIGDIKPNDMLLIGGGACALVGIVLAAMASRKRFVVEF